MKTAATFYSWWQTTVHVNYIENESLERVMQKFETEPKKPD
jgi:hypothetical protein